MRVSNIKAGITSSLEMSGNFLKIGVFNTQMEMLGGDYICSTRLPAATASVSFLGQFHGQTVLWNMTLATLLHYRSCVDHEIFTTEQEIFNCPFIEIKEGVEGVYQIRVGLDLGTIDDPVIKKSIIMIRNYKRLAIGKIEFCSAHP
jgi:hypothetical protein